MRCFIKGGLFCLVLFSSKLFCETIPWDSDAKLSWQRKFERKKAVSLHPLELPIIFFQRYLSPQDGPVCRFRPTCSVYAQKALRKYGLFKGLLLALDRLVRDNPWSEKWEDPLP